MNGSCACIETDRMVLVEYANTRGAECFFFVFYFLIRIIRNVRMWITHMYDWPVCRWRDIHIVFICLTGNNDLVESFSEKATKSYEATTCWKCIIECMRQNIPVEWNGENYKRRRTRRNVDKLRLFFRESVQAPRVARVTSFIYTTGREKTAERMCTFVKRLIGRRRITGFFSVLS